MKEATAGYFYCSNRTESCSEAMKPDKERSKVFVPAGEIDDYFIPLGGTEAKKSFPICLVCKRGMALRDFDTQKSLGKFFSVRK